MLKTPAFWYKEKSLTATLLSPLSYVYAAADACVRATKARATIRSKLPVICIGNLTSGGAGKTPTAIALRKLIIENAIALDPVFLTRGYGGSVNGPERVKADGAASSWGDEALLLARHGMAIKSSDRAQGAKLAEKHNHDLIIMDDGAQNPSLHKDIIFTVINGQDGFGNGKLLPAGPLRTSLESGFEMSNAFIIVGEDKHNIKETLPQDKPLFHAQLEADITQTINKETPYIAFAGIARPERFLSTLKECGLNIIDFVDFADHHSFTASDIATLEKQAAEKGARLITTEKDFVRLSHRTTLEHIDVLPVKIRFSDEKALGTFIKKTLKEKADSTQ